MGYEVVFLGVGKESKSGDAIAIRFGNLHDSRCVRQLQKCEHKKIYAYVNIFILSCVFLVQEKVVEI